MLNTHLLRQKEGWSFDVFCQLFCPLKGRNLLLKLYPVICFHSILGYITIYMSKNILDDKNSIYNAFNGLNVN